MMILVYFLLFLRFVECTNNPIEPKTVPAGKPAQLKCPHNRSGTVLWIRVVPGNLPEFLGKSPHFTSDRFTTTLKSGTFSLAIKNTNVNDTGVYICMTPGGTPTFLRRTDLTVVESECENMIKVHPSDPPSVFSDPNNAASLNGTKGSCCGSGPAQKLFSFLCKNNVESPQNDLQVFSGNSFFKNISSLENLCCSVTKCEIGNRSEPTTEVQNPVCQTDHTVLYVFSAAFSIGLIVTVLLIHLSIKLKNSLCGCCAADFPLQRNSVKVNADLLNQQSNEEQDLLYAVPTITQRKSVKSHKAEKEDSIYTCVREHSGDGLTEADL